MVTDARIARRRIRVLAGLIDMAASLLGMMGVMMVTVGAGFAYMKLRGDRDPSKAKAPGTAGEFGQSAWWRGALQVATLAFAPVGRNRRGPGYRVFGLRRVDASTRGAVSIRSAVVGALFDSAWQPATNSLSRPHLKREMERMTALRPQLEEIERKYPADAEARQQALLQFYKTNRVSPLPAFAWSLLPALVVQLVVLLFSRRGQTIRDRVTRTLVVVDPYSTVNEADKERAGAPASGRGVAQTWRDSLRCVSPRASHRRFRLAVR